MAHLLPPNDGILDGPHIPNGGGPGGIGGAPVPQAVIAPQLPFGADPGSITGWMLQETRIDTADDISAQMERGLTRLGDLPEPGNAGYAAAMQRMVDEIRNDGALGTYLIVSDTPLGVPRVTVMH